MTDHNGAVIVAAKITLTDDATKDKVITATTEAGEFRFANLKVGDYTLEIESVPFKRTILKALRLRTGETRHLVSVLEVNVEQIEMGVLVVAEEPIPVDQSPPPSSGLILKRPF